jgi:UDP-2,4-diacetamido-2,4,6-trideoxy-beta-L-altropyranose hydrolase
VTITNGQIEMQLDPKYEKSNMDAKTQCPVLAIRADASVGGGIGHITRSMALADAWKDVGGKPILLSYGPSAALEALTTGVDFRWLGPQRPSLSDDVDRFLELAHEVGANAVALDSYDLDRTWELKVRENGLPLLSMDDLASRAHHCNILLDTSIRPEDADRYRDLVANEAVLLLGPEYILLRRSFRMTRFEPRTERPVQRILVSFGGTDPLDYTNATLDAIALMEVPDLKVDVVTSSANPGVTDLRARATALPRMSLHLDTREMASLMATADLAVGAGGGSAWERCHAGLPSLLLLAASNQKGVATHLAAENVVRIVNGGRDGLVARLVNALRAALTDGQWRASASRRGMRMVDGLGAERVVDQLLQVCGCAPNPALEVRPATSNDMHLLWNWRNDPETRAKSRFSEEIPWGTHVAWFAERLRDDDTVMLIGLSGGRPIGALRFDRGADGSAEVSIMIDPESRGRGFGKMLLLRGCNYIERTGFAHVLHGVIRLDNNVSRRVFESVGFRMVSLDSGWGQYRRDDHTQISHST